jgi:glycerate kinase
MKTFNSILIATGAFKDVYSPIESTTLIGNIIKDIFQNNITTYTTPMIDGGEYSSEVLTEYLKLKKINISNIADPTGRGKTAYYVELNSNTAFIASSIILGLPPESEEYKNPLYLASYGFGQLLKHAIEKGYKKIILGMGGTNTVDCGIGMAQALGVSFLDKNREILSPQNEEYFTGIDLANIHNISESNFTQKYKNIEIEVVCDADTTIKQMYIPTNQKISKYFDNDREEIINFFDKNILKYCEVVETYLKSKELIRNFSYNKLKDCKYFGTAGGILLTLFALFDVQISLGSEYFSKKFELEELIQRSDIVITGEGKLDNSLQGKAPIGVSRLAKKYGKPVIYLTGNIDNSLKKFFDSYISETLPRDFVNNGVSTILSCHPFYDSVQLPEIYRDKIDFYRKNNPKLFAEILKKYFEKSGLL